MQIVNANPNTIKILIKEKINVLKGFKIVCTDEDEERIIDMLKEEISKEKIQDYRHVCIALDRVSNRLIAKKLGVAWY